MVNIVANVLQIGGGIVLLFLLYRFINQSIGVALFGVWSVVLASISVSRLADLGLTASVTRFVAREKSRNDLERAREVIDTTALTLMVGAGVVLPLVYPLAAYWVMHLFDEQYGAVAKNVLPYGMLSLWIGMIASVYLSGLDGCNRMDLRATVVVLGQSCLLILALFLVPNWGLRGLAWAQCGQSLFLLITSRTLLKRELQQLAWLPSRWRFSVLRKMLAYATHIQIAGASMLLFDPITKIFMVIFAGPAAAGYFEMANQVVFKARTLIVAANQAIVPHVASLSETELDQVASLYRENLRLLTLVVLPVFALIVSWAEPISWILTGTIQSDLVILIAVLSLGIISNIFAVPAYFTNMGTGHVSWNSMSHLAMGGSNLVLGWVLGQAFGAVGVAIAYAIAYVCGSLLLLEIFHRKNCISWSVIFRKEHIGLVLASCAVGAFGLAVPHVDWSSDFPSMAFRIGGPLIVLTICVWLHPLRSSILRGLAPS